MRLKLPYDLSEELRKLRQLEAAALKADNAVLRQRIKIFPPLEQECGRLMENMKDRIIAKAIQTYNGNIARASKATGIPRSTIYKRLRNAREHESWYREAASDSIASELINNSNHHAEERT